MANSLEIPKGESGDLNGRTDNTMAKSWKIPKGESGDINGMTDNTMARNWEIPKGESGDINGRRTENTMAEGKRTTLAKMIHKKLHRFFSKV
jgi:hypothetical protein